MRCIQVSAKVCFYYSERKTYEAGGTGGLSLMTNSLSISKIVWRTVAEDKHEKSVQSAI